jgi:membrane protease YdiL (CAAX protease family)
MDSAEQMPGSVGEVPPSAGAVLGILAIAVVVVHLPTCLLLLPGLGGWLCPSIVLSCGLMAILPFVLRRIAPRAASFRVQWLPGRWYHWVWFLGMVVLLFVFGALSKPLMDFVPVQYTPPLVRPDFTRSYTFGFVIFHAITAVLLCPVAEEIFYRGYLLEQLRKLMHWSVALLFQASLFALGHLPLILPSSGGYERAMAAFFYGIILGAWRIRFRSIIPLVLAHIVLNGVATIPVLKNQYYWADLTAQTDFSADFAAKVRSSPKCQEIYLLSKEPVEQAVPGIIAFLGDSDDVVAVYAMTALNTRYRHEAEPYLKDALASNDKNTVRGVLSVIGIWHWPNLKQDVRKVGLSADDQRTQLSAIMTLYDLDDTEGLQEISRKHPKEKAGEWANGMLRRMEEKGQPNGK